MKRRAMRWLSLLCLAGSLASGVARAQTEEPNARDLREEVQRIAVAVKDQYGREETRQIPVTIFRPPGDGPFPLVIVNHGRATTEKRAANRERSRFESLSRYLVSKGFTVFVPTRVGYGETFGEFDPEYSDACRSARIEPMSMAASDQVLATLALARKLPFADTSRWLVMGTSVGGLTSVATVWRNPPGLVGGINFAGGTGGDPDGRPGRPCGAPQIEALWRAKAAGATTPMLWLYWQNDLYWGADHPKRWHQAWVDGGGKAEFHSLSPVGADGHLGIGIDMDHWVPIAEDFLARLGFDKRGIVARPKPSGFAAIDDIAKLPNAAERETSYRKFLEGKAPRAYAVSAKSAWGYAHGDWAMGRAIGACQRRGATCKLYAVDDDVVWAPGVEEK
jgi:dienelactone hydrolase